MHRLNPSKIMTEKRVRDAVVEIADIKNEDLLYFSHSDIALSHLPYMIALDRFALWHPSKDTILRRPS